MTSQHEQKSIGQRQQPQWTTPASEISGITRPPPATKTKARCLAQAAGGRRFYPYPNRCIQAVAAVLLLRCTTASDGVAAEGAQAPPTEVAGAIAAAPPPVISRFHSMLTTALRYVSQPDHKCPEPFQDDRSLAVWGWTWCLFSPLFWHCLYCCCTVVTLLLSLLLVGGVSKFEQVGVGRSVNM